MAALVLSTPLSEEELALKRKYAYLQQCIKVRLYLPHYHHQSL
jgi:hypothetical protein